MKLTTQNIEKALIASGGFISIAAQRLKCSRQAVYDYIKKDNSLKGVVVDIRESNLDTAEYIIVSVLKSAEAKITYIDKGDVILSQPISKDEIDTSFRVLKYLGKNRGYSDSIIIQKEEKVEPTLTLEEIEKELAKAKRELLAELEGVDLGDEGH